MKKFKNFAAIFVAGVTLMANTALAVASPLDLAQDREGTLYVPLRIFAYEHGATVEWDPSTALVHINYNNDTHTISVSEMGGFIENGVSFITLEHATEIFTISAIEELLQSGSGIHGAIHRVEYGDNVAYIFGTMHAFREHWSPLADVVQDALARADVLALEVESVAAESLEAEILEFGVFLQDGQSWAEFLPQYAYEHFVKVMEAWGVEYNEETRYMNPQFLMQTLSMQVAIMLMENELEMGGQTVDSYIMDIAIERGLPIIGLEDVMQQSEIFFFPPLEVVVHNIMNFITPEEMIAAVSYSDVEVGLDTLAHYYETNNIAGLNNTFAMSFILDFENEDVATRHMREMLSNWRSTYYANRIAELLQDTEDATTFFVAIGISHVIRSEIGEGFTDIVEQLRLQGFEVVPLFE